MIDITNVEVSGFETAVRGMRNPMNSWDKSDSGYNTYYFDYFVGEKDLNLMKKLVSAGSDHSKFMRFITVTADIIAPMYWWKEFDTYKVGTVRNSCSTMNKIHAKEFTLDDFSHEHLSSHGIEVLQTTIDALNEYREIYINGRPGNYTFGKDIAPKDKDYWWNIIQILPSSYNQRATVMMNYEVLRNIYRARKEHKLDEWRSFCRRITDLLPYSELITK